MSDVQRVVSRSTKVSIADEVMLLFVIGFRSHARSDVSVYAPPRAAIRTIPVCRTQCERCYPKHQTLLPEMIRIAGLMSNETKIQVKLKYEQPGAESKREVSSSQGRSIPCRRRSTNFMLLVRITGEKRNPRQMSHRTAVRRRAPYPCVRHHDRTELLLLWGPKFRATLEHKEKKRKSPHGDERCWSFEFLWPSAQHSNHSITALLVSLRG